MKNFQHLTAEDRSRLFFLEPEEITKKSHAFMLGAALGASLYIPAIRDDIAGDVIKRAKTGSSSVIICLEDSVPDERLEEAEEKLVKALAVLAEADESQLPLIFVRPRDPSHLMRIESMIRPYLGVLTGFSLPKFTKDNAEAFLELISKYSFNSRTHLYAMPILESPSIIYGETRQEELRSIYEICQNYNRHVLNIRIGATDMASPYSLRRSRDLNIYDVKVIAGAIGDIVNVFGRADDGYTISGPVWEHFTDRERLFQPRLRRSPFASHEASELRSALILQDLDGLIREVELDRANGLWGKTVIHPTHVSLVNSMMVVSHEEYSDALDIAGGQNSGAVASSYRNKMNEVKPHTAWANRTLIRARVFGVANENISFVDLMEANFNI